MMGKRKWATIACDWYADGEVSGIADEHPEVLAVWPILIAMSKSVSHHERNPGGRIEVTRGDLARAARCSVEVLEVVLSELSEGGLIEVHRDGRHGLVIALSRFGKWQTATGSAADRKREQREREQALRGGMSRGGHVTVTLGHGESLEKEKEKEKEEEKSSSAAAQSSPELDPSLMGASTEKKQRQREAILEVLRHWQQATGRHGAAITGKAATKRQQRVRARLTEGWSVDDLKRAINGFAASSWHVEQKQLEVMTILRDGPQVEKGIELSAAAKPGSSSADALRAEIEAARSKGLIG
jgi:hypothetical protein